MLKKLFLIRESVVGMVGVSLVFIWCLLAIFAPLVSSFDPNEIVQPFVKPFSYNKDGVLMLLGSDHLGRDIWTRIVFGARTVLTYSPVAIIVAYSVGIIMGLAAGYKLGWVDDVLSRISDIILSFPVLVLYVIIIITIGASGFNIILAITFASAPGIMRIVRGMVLDLRNRDYVAAAQTRGESSLYTMLYEILPNARGPLIVDACLRMGYVIITIGVLGFLGLGLPPPDPDWGGMINETKTLALAFPHMSLYPAVALSSLVLGFNLLADGLREISLRD